MINRLIEIAFFPVFAYLFFILVELGMIIKQGYLHLLCVNLRDLLATTVLIVALILIQRHINNKTNK